MNRKRLATYLSAFLALLLTVTVVRYPEVAFEASLEGLRLWFDVVLPALLPFFTMAEILMGLGVVHLIGVFLEPVMRPAFRIPGAGAFAVAMGLASGYPIGAKITGRLRREGLCNQVESERLVSFANTADPLFMVGAVAVGMFGMEAVGWTIAASHYLAVVMVGFLMRFYRPNAPQTPPIRRERHIIRRALDELYKARQADGRPFGELFGDSVRDSFLSMLFVGGCIMIFSVVINILNVSGATMVIANALDMLLAPLHLGVELSQSLIRGAFEITIGTKAAAEAAAPLSTRVVVASAIIAWSGFSVHAQVASMLYGTDARITPYIAARLLHAVFAAGWTWLLMNPLASVVSRLVVPVMTAIRPPFAIPFLARMAWSFQASVIIVLLLLIIGVIIALLRRVKILFIRF